MKKIIGIVGSLRKNSANLALANEVKKSSKDFEMEIITLENVPFFNEDIEFPAPKEIQRIRNIIKNADGIWFFTPEYNHSYTGILKNTIDWLSRPDEETKTSVLDSKKAAISGASLSTGGTVCAQDDLVKLLSFINVNIMNKPRLMIASFHQQLNDKEEIDFSFNKKYIDKIIEEFTNFIS